MGATISAKAETVKQDWYEIDATDMVLGRLASAIAFRLRGKHKPEFTTHVDTGDYIVVKNAAKVRVTGNKAKGKIYYRHSLHTGSLKETPFEKLMEKHPTEPLQKAVKGMLPKGPLGYAMITKLKVYAGETHPHSAQQPKVWKI
jgi:large subunit ribosomal protein L13